MYEKLTMYSKFVGSETNTIHQKSIPVTAYQYNFVYVTNPMYA